MKLIYCYIENFRNIHNQEVLLSDKFQCQYKDGKMQIEQLEENSIANYVYENDFMRNLRILVHGDAWILQRAMPIYAI